MPCGVEHGFILLDTVADREELLLEVCKQKCTSKLEIKQSAGWERSVLV